jgi:hypothetical protein
MSDPLSPTLVAEQRSWHYWFEDGLVTLVGGFGCLMVAFFLLYDHERPATPLTIAVTLLALFLYGAVLLFQRQIVEWLKARITYPRTGYALPPYFAEDGTVPLDLTILTTGGTDANRVEEWQRVRKDRNTRTLVMLGLVTAASLTMMFIHNRWICFPTGMVMSAAVWFGSRKEQRISGIVLAGLPLVGLYLTIFVADHVVGVERAAYFLAGAGALFFLDGAVSLIRFLRRNPRALSSAP